MSTGSTPGSMSLTGWKIAAISGAAEVLIIILLALGERIGLSGKETFSDIFGSSVTFFVEENVRMGMTLIGGRG